MNTETAYEMMQKVLPDVVEIVTDPDVEALRLKIDQKKGDSIKLLLPEAVPLLLTKHKTATLNILAAAAGKSVAEILAQPFSDTAILTTSTIMEEIMLFFAFCLRMAMHA